MKLVAGLILWLAAAAALAAEPHWIVKWGQLSCSTQYAGTLAQILDSPDDSAMAKNVVDAIYRGHCMRAAVPSAIGQLQRLKTPGGKDYVCFQWLEGNDPCCAAAASVSTIEADVKARSGDYKVTKEEAPGIKADCLEGGSIIVFKDPDGWQRMPLIYPVKLNPPTRKITKDREAALREGCKGVDYSK